MSHACFRVRSLRCDSAQVLELERLVLCSQAGTWAGVAFEGLGRAIGSCSLSGGVVTCGSCSYVSISPKPRRASYEPQQPPLLDVWILLDIRARRRLTTAVTLRETAQEAALENVQHADTGLGQRRLLLKSPPVIC